MHVRFIESGLIGYVFELPITLIHITLVLALRACEEQVLQAIPINVADAYTAAMVGVDVDEDIERVRLDDGIGELDSGAFRTYSLEPLASCS